MSENDERAGAARMADTLNMIAVGLRVGRIKSADVEMLLADGAKRVPLLHLVEAALKGTRYDLAASQIDGYELVATVPDGARIVDMIEHKGMVFVAATNGIYRLSDDCKTLIPIEFAPPPGTSCIS